MYTTKIPGQISEFQLRAIETIATLVPEGGNVVEVGSLFGKSSYAWAKSVNSSVQVYCVDPWEGNEGIRPLEKRLNIKYGIEQFKAYTKDCDNITALKGYSPRDFIKWDKAVDLYYEDAVHTNPVLRQNLEFWVSHLTPNGIICGDDYRPRFADVVCEVRKLAHKHRRKLIIVDFFWCLLPTGSSEALYQVTKKLEAIQADCMYVRAKDPISFALQVSDIPESIRINNSAIVTVRCTNDGAVPLSEWHAAWSIAIRLQHKGDGTIIDEIIPLEPFLFQPDITRDIELKLEIGPNATIGDYSIEAGLLTPENCFESGIKVTANASSITVK